MTCSFERCWVAQRHQENLRFLKQSLTELRPRIREVQQPAKSLKRNLKTFNHLEVALGHCNRAAAQLATPQVLVKQLPMCIFCVYSLCAFSVYKFQLLINIKYFCLPQTQ